jgi:quaternary ammonium compound-resistance protein SugE
MAWVVLGSAGLMEISFAFFMKKSAGFTLFAPTAITMISAIASFALLSISMKTLPLGTAYAVWTGIGTVGAFLLGIACLGEAASLTRSLAAVLIVTGIMMMKFSSIG